MLWSASHSLNEWLTTQPAERQADFKLNFRCGTFRCHSINVLIAALMLLPPRVEAVEAVEAMEVVISLSLALLGAMQL